MTYVSHELCKLTHCHFVVWIANIKDVTICSCWILL
jgi:hypothetical protein